jgi:hypothetical protein
MKSLPKELTKTSCKKCIFAVYEGKTQTGCKFDRIDKYSKQNKVIEAYDDESEFYVIKDFCNHYMSEGNSEDLESISHQLAPSFDILIDCQDITNEQSNKIKDLLDKLSYYKNKVRVYFYYNHTQGSEAKSLSLELIAIYQPKLNASLSVCLEAESYLQEHILKKCFSTYNCLISCANLNNIDIGILDAIDKKINTDIEKILCAKSGDMTIFSTYLYRMYYYSQENYSNIQNNISKIMLLSQENNMIIDI